MDWLLGLLAPSPSRHELLPVIGALAETLLPAEPDRAAAAKNTGDTDLAIFYRISGKQQSGQMQEVIDRIDKNLTPESKKELYLVLTLLTWRIGCLLLCGASALVCSFPFVAPFAELPLTQREIVLQSWATSSIASFRKAFTALKGLIMAVVLTSLDDTHTNPLWPAMGYPGPSIVDPAKVNRKTVDAHKALQAALLPLGKARQQGSSPAQLRDMAAAKGLLVQDVLRPEGKELAEEAGAGLVVKCDAVVVGSGAGAGPCAAQLAAAGLRVVILEKGDFTPNHELSLHEGDALGSMYEKDGLLATEDGNIFIWAGATVGGGTRVNWCVSFRTPEHVRQEWAGEHGLPVFTSERYTHAMDAICQRLGVSEEYQHGKQAQKMTDGMTLLGLRTANMPRNCVSHDCGHCCFGCPTGDKQDMTTTFLADAARNSAKVVTGIYADRIILAAVSPDSLSNGHVSHDLTNGVSSQVGCADLDSNSNHASHAEHARAQQAEGVVAYVGTGTDRIKCVFKASIVVSSAGSINSPALLLRSGITVNGNVGKHLHLHPSAVAPSIFSEREHGKINMWEGPMMTAYSPDAPDWEGSGYGPMVSTPPVHPGLFSAGAPWLTGAAYRDTLAHYSNTVLPCTYVRDKGEGRVTIDKQGYPRVHYQISPFDQKSLWKGLEIDIRAMAAAGAESVSNGGCSPDDTLYLMGDPEEDRPRVNKFINKLHETKYEPYRRAHLSMHQMGSCRMGSSPQTSVTDGQGHCWDVAGLYVADASCFPTASGVNPMITTESIAYMVGQGMASKYRHLAGKRRGPVDIKYEEGKQ
ncbi:hypothetical protein WJX77_012681 [Trebouxia sp. C0004]